MGYNIQIHFTTRNRRDSVCNRKEDREKCIFTEDTEWFGLERGSGDHPVQPRPRSHRAGYTGTRPGGLGMTPERETSRVSHGKENPVLMGLTAAPGLKESTAGDEALSTPTVSTLRAGERGTLGPDGGRAASPGRGSHSRTWGRAGSAPAAGEGPRL